MQQWIPTGTVRPREAAEVAFGAIRILLADRLFWGLQARLTLTSLGEVIGVTRAEVANALSGPRGEGLVRMDFMDDCVSLTEQGAVELGQQVV